MNKGVLTTLDKVKLNTSCTVININNKDNKLFNRMLDFGIVKNSVITPLYKSIFGCTVAYLIKDSVIALRKEDASSVNVII